MPWKEVTPMEELIRFVTLARGGQFTITDLCEQFEISRMTASKHLERCGAEGLTGLQACSHAPKRPHRTDEQIGGAASSSHLGIE